jgi:hypothetical protein
MENKYQFENVINSCKNIKKVEPSPFLFEKIKVKIETGNLTQRYSNDSNPTLIWLLAFGISLVITINILIISKKESNSSYNFSNDSIDLKYPQFNYYY